MGVQAEIEQILTCGDILKTRLGQAQPLGSPQLLDPISSLSQGLSSAHNMKASPAVSAATATTTGLTAIADTLLGIARDLPNFDKQNAATIKQALPENAPQ